MIQSKNAKTFARRLARELTVEETVLVGGGLKTVYTNASGPYGGGEGADTDAGNDGGGGWQI